MHDDAGSSRFDAYVATAQAARGRFGHREHLHVAWLALRDHELQEATAVVCAGIRRTAAYEKVPQKYHHTLSVTWLRLVDHHVREAPAEDFETLIERVPHLQDKALLRHHFTPAVLSSSAARHGWVEPDLAPLP